MKRAQLLFFSLLFSLHIKATDTELQERSLYPIISDQKQPLAGRAAKKRQYAQEEQKSPLLEHKVKKEEEKKSTPKKKRTGPTKKQKIMLGQQLGVLFNAYYHQSDRDFETLEYDKEKCDQFKAALKKHIALMQAMFPNKTKDELWELLINLPLNKNRDTALHIAAMNSDPYLAQLLLKKGASIKNKTVTGLSPMNTAHQRLIEETSPIPAKVYVQYNRSGKVKNRKVIPQYRSTELLNREVQDFQKTALILAKAEHAQPGILERIKDFFSRN